VENPLEQARRHVSEGEHIVAEQESRVAKLRRKGAETEQAETLLDSYRMMLAEMRAHLAAEEKPGR